MFLLDIAISAPFSSGNDSGTVYIYHSTGTSQLLSTSYQQVYKYMHTTYIYSN